MTDHYRQIYLHKAALYDRMVSHEDYQGNILPALQKIRPLSGLDVVEFGAGSGRLTRLLIPHVRFIRAFDLSAAMLEVARPTLRATGLSNWSLAVGDNKSIPVESGTADLSIAGWSFSNVTSWETQVWKREITPAVDETLRVLKPGGTAIIIETLGTGYEQPTPPHEGLAAYYAWLEAERGFSHAWIRTDYQFESPQQADELTRFFFGDALADRILREGMTILPECTGLWWKTI